ncbi:PKD domain-containing protein [Aquimarina sp. RZ0]|uniref:PKD domain-containing protein n=1 Tax=Aquimarina sp. RZ0 TaxID=2607730 RepID=UPI0011F20B4D|nr:PKD domain-containing protein [Aquimarina sp. RZ0]KAA1245330.1 hypothetical protein F0000_12480 [Aquimarina sp. RZ0]
MKKSNNTANYHLDKSVVLFFIITILVTASVFAFKFINYTPCEIVDFEFNDKKDYRVGEIVRFKDNTKGVTQRAWDFGDSSKIDTRISPYHTYEKPGLYIVKLKVNGRCESQEEITINEKIFILDSTKLANFDIPRVINVGKTLKIEDKTLGATSWEWRFGETASINSTEKNPEYVYKTPGLKTVILVVNGDIRYATKKKITVLPEEKPKDKPRPIVKPKDPKPRNPGIIPVDPIGIEPVKEEEEFKAPFISKKSFEDKLVLVADKKATAESFSEYLCGNLDLTIIANKKKTTFMKLCERIRRKGMKLKELEISREENNCINNIVIRYKNTRL